MTQNNTIPGAQDGSNAENANVYAMWVVGDWVSIVERFGINEFQGLDDSIKIYLAAALLQLNDTSSACKIINSMSGCKESKLKLIRILISGVHNVLGKCYSYMNNTKRSNEAYMESLTPFVGKSVALIQTRTIEQNSQCGIPSLAKYQNNLRLNTNVVDLLNGLLHTEPEDVSLRIALAETASLEGDYQSSIIHWQAVASLLGEHMPIQFYERLRLCYEGAGRFPLAGDDEERLKGDRDKHDILSEIHKALDPQLYLEIGVESGKSLSLARCKAIGVDPMPRVIHKLAPTTEVLTCTSDMFFSQFADAKINSELDLAFIDGMHLFEYALRDFINAEKYSNKNTLIIIDDIFPVHPLQASRDRKTRAWTGDVWKVYMLLKRYRRDLVIQAVDAYPTGLLLISNLDPSNRVLSEGYDNFVVEYSGDAEVPDEILSREHACSGNDEKITEMLQSLRKCKISNH